MQTTSVVFDDKIELVGVKLGAPTAKRGRETDIKLYFKALDKIPTSYRMFMHVDRVGSSSRIHGDHWVLNLVKETEDQNQCVGCYATTHWLKGALWLTHTTSRSLLVLFRGCTTFGLAFINLAAADA